MYGSAYAFVYEPQCCVHCCRPQTMRVCYCMGTTVHSRFQTFRSTSLPLYNRSFNRSPHHQPLTFVQPTIRAFSLSYVLPIRRPYRPHSRDAMDPDPNHALDALAVLLGTCSQIVKLVASTKEETECPVATALDNCISSTTEASVSRLRDAMTGGLFLWVHC